MSDTNASAAPAAPTTSEGANDGQNLEGQQGQGQPTAEAAPATEAGAEPVEYFLRVDGQEIRVPDAIANIVAELQKTAPDEANHFLMQWQKTLSADKRLKEASEAKAKFSIPENLKGNKAGAVKWIKERAAELGIDYRMAAAEEIAEALTFEQLTPEQREAHEAKAEAAKYRDELEALKAEKEKTHETAREQQLQDYYMDVVDKVSAAVPEWADPITAQRAKREMIRVLAESNQYGTDITGEQLIAAVKRRLSSGGVNLADLAKLPGNEALKQLPPELVDAIVKAKLAEHKAKAATRPPSTQAATPEKPEKRMRISDALKEKR